MSFVAIRPADVIVPEVVSSASFLRKASSTLSVIDPPKVTVPPLDKLVPAVTVTASSANLAIGISSLSISASSGLPLSLVSIAAASVSETEAASNLLAIIVPLELISPDAVMIPLKVWGFESIPVLPY